MDEGIGFGSIKKMLSCSFIHKQQQDRKYLIEKKCKV